MYGLKLPDGVVTLKFGEMGCILTRRIFLGILLTVLAFGITTYKIRNFSGSHSHYHEESNKMQDLSTPV